MVKKAVNKAKRVNSMCYERGQYAHCDQHLFLCYIICFAANEVKKNILTKSFPRSFLIRANKATKEFAYLDEWSLSLHVSLLPYALREFVPHVQIKKVIKYGQPILRSRNKEQSDHQMSLCSPESSYKLLSSNTCRILSNTNGPVQARSGTIG
eukprot:scaffold10533_cov273-Chaetoceros_neogracile.AAC.10